MTEERRWREGAPRRWYKLDGGMEPFLGLCHRVVREAQPVELWSHRRRIGGHRDWSEPVSVRNTIVFSS